MPETERALHIVIPDYAPHGWRWIEPENPGRPWAWHFYRSGQKACTPALRAARHGEPSVLITHGFVDPRRCAMLRALNAWGRPPLIAFSFHAPYQFGFRETFLFRRLAPYIDHFVVHSEYERRVYSDQLDIPISRMEAIPWYHEDVEVTTPPLIDGPYLSAVGASMRDYRTLFLAMARLPELKLVAIVRPENLEGITIPPNVTVMQNAPKEDLWNVQYHSRLHVVPLAETARTGHACLTQGMFFGLANVVADVPCVTEYVNHGETAMLYRPGDVDHLVSILRELWDDDRRIRALGETARAHALARFSMQAMGDHLERIVDRFALPRLR